MNRLLIILLLCGLSGAQTAPAPASLTSPPQAATPAVNLNDSDNARKARAVLDKSVEALGGQAYLTYENRVEEGRYYPLYHGRTNSTGITTSTIRIRTDSKSSTRRTFSCSSGR